MGLEGGGDLTTDIILSLKAPQSITLTSNNSVDPNGHTHEFALTKNDLLTIIGPVPSVYIGTDPNYTNYPIGHTMVVKAEGSASAIANMPINNTVTVYNINPPANGFSGYTVFTTGSAGTALPGQWANRGVIPYNDGTGTKYKLFVEKIAI